MLREFQDEITRLKAKLAEQEKAMTNGSSGGFTSTGDDDYEDGEEKVEVIEKLIYKETGISEAQLKEMNDKIESEKEVLRKKAEDERRELLLAKAKTDEERKNIEERLKKESLEKTKALQAQAVLNKKLKAMEEKLLMGGKLMDQAAAQEEV